MLAGMLLLSFLEALAVPADNHGWLLLRWLQFVGCMPVEKHHTVAFAGCTHSQPAVFGFDIVVDGPVPRS